MTIKKLKEILECNEPVFHYNGKQYGICFVGGKFIAGEVGEEDSDESFYTVEELLENWKIEGVAFGDIVKDLQW
ncbi:MAG TPA: hypothetical protein IAB62_10445 [Candidatus Coprocola pullicola]|nr:hypothetical protein [Candidatus Coprocola pullicola]